MRSRANIKDIMNSQLGQLSEICGVRLNDLENIRYSGTSVLGTQKHRFEVGENSTMELSRSISDNSERYDFNINNGNIKGGLTLDYSSDKTKFRIYVSKRVNVPGEVKDETGIGYGYVVELVDNNTIKITVSSETKTTTPTISNEPSQCGRYEHHKYFEKLKGGLSLNNMDQNLDIILNKVRRFISNPQETYEEVKLKSALDNINSVTTRHILEGFVNAYGNSELSSIILTNVYGDCFVYSCECRDSDEKVCGRGIIEINTNDRSNTNLRFTGNLNDQEFNVSATYDIDSNDDEPVAYSFVLDKKITDRFSIQLTVTAFDDEPYYQVVRYFDSCYDGHHNFHESGFLDDALDIALQFQRQPYEFFKDIARKEITEKVAVKKAG